MKLLKLCLKNFRQFKGAQELEFAAPAGGRRENVTVVFGENERGKTGIFRAIMFCLYGDQQLSQDEQVDQKEIYCEPSAGVRRSGASGAVTQKQ